MTEEKDDHGNEFRKLIIMTHVVLLAHCSNGTLKIIIVAYI